jgi:hypothetical protein
MSETKWTPGPWEVGEGDYAWVPVHPCAKNEGGGQETICQCDFDDLGDVDADEAAERIQGIEADGLRYVSREEGHANARLIAAAPCMYEALRMVAGYENAPEVLKVVDAALSRARGEG